MFSRIREAARIITYREPQNGQDFAIMECVKPRVSAAGRAIANFFEVFTVVYIIGRLAGPLAGKLEHLIPGPVALTTLVGSLGALLMLLVHWLRNDIQQKISSHINLTDTLAPFFGHKLDNTFRVLR